jgi:hypothetical protein
LDTKEIMCRKTEVTRVDTNEKINKGKQKQKKE